MTTQQNKFYESVESLEAQISMAYHMQIKTNDRMATGWRDPMVNYPFLRALAVEAAEAMDHIGYKWWKKTEPNLDQVKLELVDIYHFLLSGVAFESEALIKGVDSMVAKAQHFQLKKTAFDKGDVLDKLEHLMTCAGDREVAECIWMFFDLCTYFFDSIQELTELYAKKNVLNFFRQDHGDKEGTYQKIWAGREDNEHLTELCSEVDWATESAAKDLYDLLEKRYAACLESATTV